MPAYKDTNNPKLWMTMTSYTDLYGKKKRKAKRGFKTKSEALAWERDFLAFHTKDLEIPLDTFYEMYMTDLDPRIRYNTKINKRTMYEKHISPILGHKIISKILVTDVIEWQNSMLTNNFSNTYLRTLNNQVLAIFNHAEKFYNLERNPFKRIDPIGSERTVNVNFWTKKEFDTFISVVDDLSSFIHFNVLFYTGIRVGELIAIKLKDINLEKRLISVNKSAQFEKGKYIFTDTKTPKSNREITIPQFLANMLKDFISKFYFIQPDEQLFMTNKARLSRELKSYALKAGVKRIRIHDLRHSHASFLIEQGIEPLLIQARLGHEKIETTLKTYSHLYPNRNMQVADYMDSIITMDAITTLPDIKNNQIEYTPKTE